MNRINILDCTLRDGGYINNWNFGKAVIKDIFKNLSNSNIDIIECGFIRNVEYDPNSSVYPNMSIVEEMIAPKSEKSLYAVMIEQRNYLPDLVCGRSDRTADLIRLTFRRNEWESARITARELIDKGYLVCIQPVGTASYDDLSLIELLQDVNDINPFAFYLVDTLGIMYRHDMRRFFYLIDNNLSKNIILGFHSHNNLQMSFANAQEIIRLCRDRNIIIDSTCYGMGRGVGNLATELICDYINRNIGQRYILTPVLNVIDKYLMSIYSQQRWGYDLPYFLSATFKCHPNYAAHLIKKETLSIELIEKILSLIPEEKRSEYDLNLLEELYLRIQNCEIDDRASYDELRDVVNGQDVVIVGSGQSIITYKERIKDVIRGKLVISVNFIPDDIAVDYIFVSNEKRTHSLSRNSGIGIIATSNLRKPIEDAVFFNYSDLLGEGEHSDNAGAMLIRILRNLCSKKLFIAGFDGFDTGASSNYAIQSFKVPLDYDTAKKRNEDISKQIRLALDGVDYEFITPTKYQIGNI